TVGQEFIVKLLSNFLVMPVSGAVFLLRGYAGTGKTTLVGALTRTLDKLGRRCVLLSPTGRSAKIFSAYAGHPASTIHRKIYRQQSFSAEAVRFTLNDNLARHTLFIVDEASMIANEGLSGSIFGTGRLLDDLVSYVYSAPGCRLLLTGDTAQLPPVGEEQSPALHAEAMKGYGLEVMEGDLTEVVRQGAGSGILWNATRLRERIAAGEYASLPKLKIAGFADIRTLPGSELLEALERCYGRDGVEETMVVCRSNKRANLYNKGIRARLLWREEELEAGDLLMVAKNNYYWMAGQQEIDFIANGETAVVRRVHRVYVLYGFRFARVTLSFPDCGGLEREVNLLMDTLQSDAPALSAADNQRLFHAVLEDYADIPLKRERMEKMKADPHYNALQVKYAYAVTCHKAQGGQWKNVFLDSAYVADEFLTPDYFRWLYTAFTRATGTLYLVNYPQEQVLGA
ncbi:MAG: AAA family ATPase, partial [Prevotellaceae bacterium]|nr:AAA family ATPase [Prevotellaceae bacterium]